MNEYKLIYGAGFIDDDLVCEAIDYKPKKISLAPWACAAAAVVVVAGAFAVWSRGLGKVPVESNSPGTSTASGEYPAFTTTSEFPSDSGDMHGTAHGNITGDYHPSSFSGGTSNCDPGYSTSEPSGSEHSASSSSISTSDFPVTPLPGLEDYPAYADQFEGFAEENPAAYGPPPTCEEIMNNLAPDPDYPEYDVDSFYMIEVISALPNEKYMEMAGWRDGYYDTVYHVRLVEDLISGEELDRAVCVRIPAGLGACIQTQGDPTYAPGERFAAVLTKPCEGYDFVMTVCDYALRYDLPQGAFTEKDGETMLYFRGRGLARQPISDLPFDVEEINITSGFSTPQNPAIYVQKVALGDLVEFLRDEWQRRGISSHFEN